MFYQDLILIAGYAVMLFFLIYKLTRKNAKHIVRLHLLIFIVYSCFIAYNRIFNQNEDVLDWLFYGAVILLLHGFIMILIKLLK